MLPTVPLAPIKFAHRIRLLHQTLLQLLLKERVAQGSLMASIVIYADGTWNRPEEDLIRRNHPINVLKLARGISVDMPNGNRQWNRSRGGARGTVDYVQSNLNNSDEFFSQYNSLMVSVAPLIAIPLELILAKRRDLKVNFLYRKKCENQ